MRAVSPLGFFSSSHPSVPSSSSPISPAATNTGTHLRRLPGDLSLLLPRNVRVSPGSRHGVGVAGGEQLGLLFCSVHSPQNSSRSGVCKASQAVELFPSVCPEIVVRDARVEDCWEVAETHCSSFFPNYTFPLDLVLRIDRFVALLSGFSVPPGCMRTCLVAVTGGGIHDDIYIGSEGFKVGGFEGKFSFNRGSVAGILTVDTVADFLPRKGPLRQRRTGIAYISNVAVRESERRKGIAKQLIAKAEARAWSWGCRAVALHCDATNTAAIRLYKGQGYKCIRVPERANWPQPKITPDMQFNFMMKLQTHPHSLHLGEKR